METLREIVIIVECSVLFCMPIIMIYFGRQWKKGS